MRTTLNIANDVLQAVKEMARREHRTTGEVISELARRALTSPLVEASKQDPDAVHGLRPFPSRGRIVTNELIDSLREDDAY